jgi:hypothetical protein
MDFSLSVPNRHSSSGMNSSEITIKSEPMDYESNSGPYHNNPNGRSEDSLNAFGPQVATFHPEASAKSSNSRYSDHSKTGWSGFLMLIFRTQFLSGFRMVGHLALYIWKLDKFVWKMNIWKPDLLFYFKHATNCAQYFISAGHFDKQKKKCFVTKTLQL